MYFEDVEVGTVEEFGSYEMTKEEIVEFATKYDPQPFHLSEEAGKAMIFGGLCASGWHTGSVVMRMIVDHMKTKDQPSQSMGSPGLESLRWTKPVFPGDVLRVRSTILDKRESRSRPDIGSVYIKNEVFNQNDELVAEFNPVVIHRRRPQASSENVETSST